jgi:hypothetical protein
MASFRTLDMRLIDDVFDMHGGYVLDFSDRTFSEFFRQDLGIIIDDPKFLANGTSKAKRLRCFLQTVQDQMAARVLVGLWEYRRVLRRRSGGDKTSPEIEAEFGDLVVRLGGQRPVHRAPPPAAPTPAAGSEMLKSLAAAFLALSTKEPQARGYAFESWLKSAFDAYGLDARGSFRLVGEQIDGSLQHGSDVYLVEARWRNARADIADLHAFHGKLEQKASWSRGLFISMSGFTTEGLEAFGRGKRLVCMDGFDLYQMLERALPFDEVLKRKARRAAETGSPYASVRDLFP